MALAADYHNTHYYQAPYRPCSRSKTTYGSMNQWMKMKDKGMGQRVVPSHVPITLTDANWREIKYGSDAPYRPFEDKHRTDEYYRRYLQLSGNVAHRYPNPGFPRERQGAIGGSWRHVKEVLGHSGSQVCFVDGLVRLYDNEANRFNPQRSVMNQAAMATPAYALSRHNVLSYVKDIERRKEQAAYKPWEETSIRELPKASNDMSSSASRYKGYHTFRQ